MIESQSHPQPHPIPWYDFAAWARVVYCLDGRWNYKTIGPCGERGEWSCVYVTLDNGARFAVNHCTAEEAKGYARDALANALRGARP